MNKVKKLPYLAVFLLIALILTNAVFIHSASGNKGSAGNPDFTYDFSFQAPSDTLGYLIKTEPIPTPTSPPRIDSASLPAALREGSKSLKSESQTTFILPTEGLNWGEIHSENAVDIANYCGSLVFAAESGYVIDDPAYGSGLSGWNGGYGLFVLLEHSSRLKTRYAHLSKVLVSKGDYVRQGTLIGYVGATGQVHGQTGCHLHFEVLGGNNPFAKQY